MTRRERSSNLSVLVEGPAVMEDIAGHSRVQVVWSGIGPFVTEGS
jgi:hypothetical protein